MLLSRKFFSGLSKTIRRDYVKHTFNKSKDVFGKGFKQYSLEYGIKKKANKFKRQAGAFASSTAPVLTGDFMNDAKPFSTQNSAGVRWASYGSRVNHLSKMGRKVTDQKQPFPEKIIKMINTKVKSEIKRKLPQETKVKIKFGK